MMVRRAFADAPPHVEYALPMRSNGSFSIRSTGHAVGGKRPAAGGAMHTQPLAWRPGEPPSARRSELVKAFNFPPSTQLRRERNSRLL